MTKVLLVEDDNNLREIYEARLAAEGYEINAAQDGEEALEVAKKVQPDLIISDVMMPRISGFEMLDILRNTQGLQHTKVIMLTALGQEEDKTRADSLGADRYLVKSQVTLEDIVKAADELLNGAPQTETAGSQTTPAPQPSEQLSPTAPPAVAAAAHSAPSSQVEQPAATLNTFENNQPQPEPAAALAPAQPMTPAAPEPIVGGPAPVTTATVAADPVAANDQALQAAAAQLSTNDPTPAAPAEPAAVPVVNTPTVPTLDPAPAVDTPAPITPDPNPQPVAQQPVQPVAPVMPPEAQAPQPPTLPEIERAMEQSAQATTTTPEQAPADDMPTAPAAPVEQPATVTPETAPTIPNQVAAPTAEQPIMADPEVAPTEQPVADLSRPTISAAPAPTEPASATPEITLPDTQSTAQEASTVSDQIADFGAQFPANVGEVVETPNSVGAPIVSEPVAPAPADPSVPTNVAPVPVTEVPVDPVATPTSTPAVGGQRTIQPLVGTKPAIDINELAAREGHVITPPGSPSMPGQAGPGGIFTPNQNGSANDAAL